MCPETHTCKDSTLLAKEKKKLEDQDKCPFGRTGEAELHMVSHTVAPYAFFKNDLYLSEKEYKSLSFYFPDYPETQYANRRHSEYETFFWRFLISTCKELGLSFLKTMWHSA